LLLLQGSTVSFGDKKITGEVLLSTGFSLGILMTVGILTGDVSLSIHVFSGMATDDDAMCICSTESLEDVPLLVGFSVGILMGDDPLSTDLKGRILMDDVS
jgi:hypothetical protein